MKRLSIMELIGRILAGALILGLCGCVKSEELNTESKIVSGDLCPEIEIYGNLWGPEPSKYNIAPEGRKFIYFFIPGCGDCKAQTPEIMRLWDLVKDDERLEFLVIMRGGNDFDTGIAEAKNYWTELAEGREEGIENMPPLYYDNNRETYSRFADMTVPRRYITNQSGIVTWESGEESRISAENLLAKIAEANEEQIPADR